MKFLKLKAKYLLSYSSLIALNLVLFQNCSNYGARLSLDGYNESSSNLLAMDNPEGSSNLNTPSEGTVADSHMGSPSVAMNDDHTIIHLDPIEAIDPITTGSNSSTDSSSSMLPTSGNNSEGTMPSNNSQNMDTGASPGQVADVGVAPVGTITDTNNNGNIGNNTNPGNNTSVGSGGSDPNNNNNQGSKLVSSDPANNSSGSGGGGTKSADELNGDDFVRPAYCDQQVVVSSDGQTVVSSDGQAVIYGDGSACDLRCSDLAKELNEKSVLKLKYSNSNNSSIQVGSNIKMIVYNGIKPLKLKAVSSSNISICGNIEIESLTAVGNIELTNAKVGLANISGKLSTFIMSQNNRTRVSKKKSSGNGVLTCSVNSNFEIISRQ